MPVCQRRARQRQVHYVVSPAADPQALLGDLRRELLALNAISAEERDTTLLIAPACMEDFLDFNDFTALADDLIEELELDGIILQVAFSPPVPVCWHAGRRRFQLHQPHAVSHLAFVA